MTLLADTNQNLPVSVVIVTLFKSGNRNASKTLLIQSSSQNLELLNVVSKAGVMFWKFPIASFIYLFYFVMIY